MEQYHDHVWDCPANDDNELFERLTMQIVQAGLSWKTILLRHDAFREAFSNFDITTVANYGAADVERLHADKNIIRNKLKIESTIENVKRILALQDEFGSFQNYLDQLSSDLPVLQQELKKAFKLMEPEIARMFVMRIGKIKVPHDPHGWRYKG